MTQSAFPDALRDFVYASRDAGVDWTAIVDGVRERWPEYDAFTERTAYLLMGARARLRKRLLTESAQAFKPRPTRNEMCRRMRYIEGEVYECGMPSHGKTYCRDCAHELSVGPNQRRYNYMPGGYFEA